MSKRDPTIERTLPLRVAKRPDPESWRDDEMMTLPEAAFLFFPDGPLTTHSLRVAVRDQRLDAVRIAGKILTTKTAVRRMGDFKPPPSSSVNDAQAPAEPAAQSIAEMKRRYLAKLGEA